MPNGIMLNRALPVYTLYSYRNCTQKDDATKIYKCFVTQDGPYLSGVHILYFHDMSFRHTHVNYLIGA